MPQDDKNPDDKFFDILRKIELQLDQLNHPLIETARAPSERIIQIMHSQSMNEGDMSEDLFALTDHGRIFHRIFRFTEQDAYGKSVRIPIWEPVELPTLLTK